MNFVNHIGITDKNIVGQPRGNAHIHLPIKHFGKLTGKQFRITEYENTIKIRAANIDDTRLNTVNGSNAISIRLNNYEKFVGKWLWEIDGDYIILTEKIPEK